MKLTPELKAWLTKHAGVSADASDAVFKAAMTEALMKSGEGSLSAEKLVELTKTAADDEASEIKDLLTTLTKEVAELKGSKGDGYDEDGNKKPPKKKPPKKDEDDEDGDGDVCLLYTSPSPRDQRGSRMPSSA